MSVLYLPPPALIAMWYSKEKLMIRESLGTLSRLLQDFNFLTISKNNGYIVFELFHLRNNVGIISPALLMCLSH